MVERFFSTTKRLNLPDNRSDSVILLSGPPFSGKTSLLFQFAFNSVVDSNDHSVVFICSRRRLIAKPPYLSQGIDPSSHVFHRIHIKYVEDEEGMNNFFAAFHMHDTFPVSVIIDDFGDFFDQRICQERYASPRGRDMAIVGSLALCCNAIKHANETGRCMLVLSDTHHGDTPRLLYIYKRWVSSIYTIRGDGVGSFVIKNDLETERKTAKYSIALEHLVLEEINETEQHQHQQQRCNVT